MTKLKPFDEMNKMIESIKQVQQECKKYSEANKVIDEAVQLEFESRKAEAEELIRRIKL